MLSIVFTVISPQGKKMTGRARARARGRARGQETVQHVGATVVSAVPFTCSVLEKQKLAPSLSA